MYELPQPGVMYYIAQHNKWPMSYPLVNEPRDEEDWSFYAEAIQAWRAWRVIDYDGVLVLQSITYRVIWLPKQEMIASCLVSSAKKPCSAVPDVEHGCGIYSLKEIDDAIAWAKRSATTERVVYGKTSIWGHCFNFTKGYLSEFAYPSFLYVPENEKRQSNIDISSEELAVELTQAYRIEAVTV